MKGGSIAPIDILISDRLRINLGNSQGKLRLGLMARADGSFAFLYDQMTRARSSIHQRRNDAAIAAGPRYAPVLR